MTSPWRGRVLAAWVDAARRRSGWIVAAAILFTALCTTYSVRNLGVQTDTDEIFAADLEFRRLETELDRAFPMLENAVVVVLDASSPERAADAALALAAHLEGRPELYGDVFAPGVGPFFDRHGLLYLETEELEELADRLVAAQPFLATISRDPSLRGLFRLFERALARADAAAGRGIDLEDALSEVEASLREAARRRVRPLAFDELLVGGGEGGGKRRYVLVQLEVDYTELVPGTEAIEGLHASFAELGFGSGAPSDSAVRARLTGNLALSQEELALSFRQSNVAGGVSFVLVVGLLFMALRSTRLVLATATTLAAGLIWTAALAALVVGHLNMISVGFGVLFIGLGVDFGIHFVLRYRELRGGGEAHAEALRETASGVGGSLVLCALTTATGFLAFVPTGYRGVAELGVIAGSGLFVSLFAFLTLLPALLTVGGEPVIGASSPAPAVRLPGDAARLPARWPRAAARLPVRWPGAVLAVAAVLVGAGALWALGLEFDGNPLRVRDPGAETVRTFEELVREGDLNPWTAEVLVASLEEAEELSDRLAALPRVDRSVSLLDFVPEAQEERLALLADARMLVHLTPPDRQRSAPSVAEQQAALASLRAALAEFVASTPDSPLVARARRVAAALEEFGAGSASDQEERLALLDTALMQPIRRGLEDLAVSLAPGAVRLADLPEPLRRRLQAPDGRARVQVFPAEDLNETVALEAFVADVRSVAPRATGDAVYMLESAHTVVGSLRQAFATAAVLISLALLLLWRSLRDTALVLAPVVVATLWVVGVSVALGMSLNFANVIVLPLLLGIGVDSGIHMVHRFRESAADDLLETSTPRAVFWSSLTTIASFGSLAFATHRGMASLGQLLVLGVSLTLAANLLVLPAILEVLRRRAR